ncbi:MAG TPA: hypothetical protein VK658_09705 [Chryseolinea sp.]|nr:hypothetical protein [Chryseolinea sp.]
MKYSFIALLVLFNCQISSKHHDVIIANVNVVNISTGEIDKNRLVHIDGERITAIDSEIYDHQADTLVDGTDKYLIPGLWDMYTRYHLYFANLNMANGVIGMCENPVDMKQLSELRQRKVGKQFIVPEVYSGGLVLDGPGPDSAGFENSENETGRHQRD